MKEHTSIYIKNISTMYVKMVTGPMYTKKVSIKERKEKTHVEVGEENIHHIYIYIYQR